MMKKLLSLLLAGVLSLGLFACGGGSGDSAPDSLEELDPNEKITIEFAGWGDADEERNYQTLVNKFMEENPNIIVDYTCESSTTYMQTLTARAGNLPELFYMPDYDFLEWVANGMLLDISNYVTAEDLNKLWPDAVNEYYFDPSEMTLGKSEGARLYGLPKDLGPFTLVYNKTLLNQKIAQYGLNSQEIYSILDPTDPMTWEELIRVLKAVDPDGGADGVYGISHYELQAAVYSNDANFFTDDASEERISNKNFYEAVQFIVDLTTKHNVMPTAANQVANNGYTRFKGSGCIFSFMGPWDCANFWRDVTFEYDILPVAYNGNNPNAKSTAWVGSMGYCLNGKLRDSKKIAAAIKLANYLCANEDAQREFYKLGQQVPNIQTMAFGEYLEASNQYLTGKNPVNRNVWVDTIYNSGANDKIHGKTRAQYYTYSSSWLENLTDYFETRGMWDGNTSAEDTCKDFAEEFQAILTEMRGNM